VSPKGVNAYSNKPWCTLMNEVMAKYMSPISLYHVKPV
jgi:hypothetical protein